MAASLMTQWLFNFVIAKLTPIMLAEVTYGTYLLFGACCVMMLLYAVFCVPETKGVPLESVGLLFEGNIVACATNDLVSRARAKKLRDHHLAGPDGMRRLQSDDAKLTDEQEQAEHFEDERANA